MLSIVAISGSNRPDSYNLNLIKYYQQHHIDEIQIQILDIDDLPMFKIVKDSDTPSKVRYINDCVRDADGIMIATTEINHSIPSNIKNVIDWLSMQPGLLKNKPTLLMGASTGPLGTVRAQMHLREILATPAINGKVTHNTECFITNADDNFDDNNHVTSQKTIDVLENLYSEFIEIINERF